MENDTALSIKAAIVAFLGTLTARWGWFGWLVVAWIACMTIDYITGYGAACKNGEWSSQIAREGLWHKGGCIIVVLMSVILDCLVGYLLEHITAIELPFSYSMFLTALVLVWYILMELGSIAENVGKMGAPIPPWLKRAIKVLRSSVDRAADKAIPDGEYNEDADGESAERRERDEE